MLRMSEKDGSFDFEGLYDDEMTGSEVTNKSRNDSFEIFRQHAELFLETFREV